MSGFQNMDKLQTKLSKLKGDIQPGLMDALESCAITVRTAAVKSIAGKSSGEDYIRYNPRRAGTASAPGDPPHTDRGNLINNIQVQRDERSVDVGILGDKALYGKYLEFGTSNLPARPWLRPAYETSKSVIKSKLQSFGKDITTTLIRG